MKEEVEIGELDAQRPIPVVFAVPEYKEFVRGGVAAFSNIVVTFPVYKAMFRQQLSGKGITSVFRDLYSEGLRTLYRGVAAPFIQKTVSTSVMFGTFDFYRRSLVECRKVVTGANSEETVGIRLIASTLSGMTEALLTPFERIQSILSIPKYNTVYKNFFHAFHILRLRELYTGMSAIIYRNCIGSGLFLFFREPFQDLLPRGNNKTINLFNDFMSGAVLGACISTLSFPFNVAKVQLQQYDIHKPGLSAFGALANVINDEHSTLFLINRQRGFLGLYSGVQINFYRALISWGIINAVYEQMGHFFKE